MNSKLSKHLSHLDSSMDVLIQRLAKIDNTTLNKKPDVHSWSVNQVLNHLKLAEHYALSYCKKKIQAKDLKRAGIASKLRLGVLKTSFFLPIKFNAPKGVDGPSLPVSDNLADIKEEWKQNRGELKRFLESLTEEQEKLAVYKHPAVGRFSFKDTIKFFQSHQNVHERQIDRILKIVDR